jgi:predicted RNA polymerase sigma factor
MSPLRGFRVAGAPDDRGLTPTAKVCRRSRGFEISTFLLRGGFFAAVVRVAEDVVQEAFIRLVQQRPVPENVVGWWYRVVRNGRIRALLTRR